MAKDRWRKGRIIRLDGYPVIPGATVEDSRSYYLRMGQGTKKREPDKACLLCFKRGWCQFHVSIGCKEYERDPDVSKDYELPPEER